MKGAIYKQEIHEDTWHVIDLSDATTTSKVLELQIVTETGEKSPFRIVNLSGIEEELCNYLVDACKHLEKGKGNTCSGTGDKGDMFGIGRRNGSGNRFFNEIFAISHPNAKGYDRVFTEKYYIPCCHFQG